MGWLSSLDERERARFLEGLSTKELQALEADWAFWARANQLEPAGDWRVWLILAGRGWGKSRTGAETVQEWVISGRYRRLALIAETAADARDVLVEGPSGLLSIAPPWFRPKYEPSKRRVTWPNGAVATTYSGEKPDQLRGPEHDAAWADELAKWRYPDAWDQLQFGLRRGSDPRVVVTTTPRPIKIIRDLVKDLHTYVTRGSTYDNRANLAAPFLAQVVKRYEGTRLGRQELDAEILDDVPGALWTRAILERAYAPKAPDLRRVVVAIDPASEGGEDQCEHGIVAAGVGHDDRGYILDDWSLRGSPEAVCNKALSLYDLREADALIVEKNNGGEWIPAVFRSIRQNAPVKKVHASRGKVTRAEPVAALYEQGRISHVGQLAALEDQMVMFTPEGLASGGAADRVDALVWAITNLFPDIVGPIHSYAHAAPRVIG